MMQVILTGFMSHELISRHNQMTEKAALLRRRSREFRIPGLSKASIILLSYAALMRYKLKHEATTRYHKKHEKK